MDLGNNYYIHIGKGFDSSGYSLFKFPEDFIQVTQTQLLSNISLLKNIASYIRNSNFILKNKFTYLFDENKEIQWRKITSSNIDKVIADLTQFHFVGANFVIINKDNYKVLV